MEESGTTGQRLDAHDRVMLSGITAVFIGTLLYGWVYNGLGIAFGIGLLLLGASLVVALTSRGGILSQVALPFFGMTMVSLMIHVSHGHNEAHFAVFAFLAVLVTYRRVVPILVGAAAIAVQHLTFNYFQSLGWGPMCFSEPSFMRVLEHAAFVVAESAVLLILASRAKADFTSAEELTGIAGSLVHEDGSVDLSVAGRAANSPAAKVLVTALSHISTMIEQVRDAANTINRSTAELSSGNDSLSQRTEQTASSLQETAASVEQITSTMLTSSGSAEQANGLAGTASNSATRGGEAVTRVVKTMSDIQDSSRKISEIIGVIDGIAFQTNILALNAAVEAARAGDQGRGFAVVASEVRSLAQRSASAAKEIKILITDSVAQVQVGSSLVSDAGQTIGEIVSQVRGVSTLIKEMTNSTKEQTQGIGQINEAIGHLESNTQQNVALVEEIAASTIQLRQQAERLVGALAVFASGNTEGRLLAAH